MKNLVIILCLFLVINFIRTDELNDKLKANLIDKFKSKFFDYISQYFSQKDLAQIGELQFDLLRIRNSECPSEHAKLNGLFDKNKNSSLFEKILAKISNNSEGLEDEIVDDINKIVICFYFLSKIIKAR
jgi:hypothetical protein